VSLGSVQLSVQLSGPSALGADAGMTGFSLSLPPWARINYDLPGLAARGGLGLPACNRSIFWAVGQTRGAPHHFYTAVCCVLRMSLDRFERRPRSPVLLYAFDLIELNGDDMRRDPLEVRKATLRSMLAKSGLGSRFNEHLEGDGPTVF